MRKFVALLAGVALIGGFAPQAMAQTGSMEKTESKTGAQTKTTTKEDSNSMGEMRERQVESDKRAKTQRSEMGKETREKTSEVKKEVEKP
ncbi:hypothetical protein [Gloeobacter violaceus]|uniref:Gsl2995 protein n=1 Tax=Gloeobacter violaceus (strain ATCC 29082 / PCC 7421) TaxID=251221 RepID=Q7NCI4_GLOVI|nr:hypothetical protein [Gloeobacter violaceus]BAC90936.1 gsl2995 [Gloeobacter violaceus PCC 7421]